MNNIKLIFATLFIVLSNANAQVVTLDYNNFSSSDCDVFGNIIPVQGIFHQTKVGDVTKNSSIGGLQLKYEYNNGGSNQKGSEFAINYFTFKKDYKYRVKITARSNNNYSEPAGIKCNFNPIGIDPFCDGVNYLNSNNGTFSTGDNWFQSVNGTSFTEYIFESDYLSSAQTYLGIGTFSLFNIGANSEWNQTIYIKKIEIIELPPPPSFSISPTSTTVSCGNNSPKTFTVIPSNIPDGANVEYNWNVGSGWLQDGDPVSNFTTTSTSVTLVPVLFPPSNVNVTPVLDGENFPQLSSNISLSNFETDYLITGPSALCSFATYSVNNLPNGISVTSWSVSNSNIATITGNGNFATLSALGNGVVTVEATLTNSCGQTDEILKSGINVGDPTVTDNFIIGGSDNMVVNSTSTLNVNPAIGATQYYWFISTINTETACQGLSTQNRPRFFQNGNFFSQSITTTNNYVTIDWGDCTGTYAINCRAVNSCGTSDYTFTTTNVFERNDFPCDQNRVENNSNEIKIYPNPTKNGFINVRRPDPRPCDILILNKEESNSIKSLLNIVKIFDMNGNILYENSFNTNEFEIKKSNLKSGRYILNIESSDGRNTSDMIIVE
mgnify:CR=1 FL=1